jgi:hypothetical protein
MGLKLGDQISFATDSTITATVAGEREFDYGHQTWKLSPLTIKSMKNKHSLTRVECIWGRVTGNMPAKD